MPKKLQTSEAGVIPRAAPLDNLKPQMLNMKREVTRSPGFVSIYANDIQIHTSPWDVRLVLGEMGDIVAAENPAYSVKEIGELRISPQLAKKLMMLLGQQIQTYESIFGEIPVAKD
jgi:Protein of unknown function (DUF3467)